MKKALMEILSRGEVTVQDFRLMYPNQDKRSLSRTARYHMKVVEDLGLAEKNNGKWKVKNDLLEVVKEFNRLKERIGFQGDLYEFISVIFNHTKEILKRKSFIEVLAQEYGVREKTLREFIEGFLDNIEWKTEEDLRVFLEDFKKGLWVRLSSEIYSALKHENAKEIKEIQRKGFTKGEATIILLNAFLKKIPLSMEVWKRIERDSVNGIEGWILDRLTERRKHAHVEFVPVDKVTYKKLQDEVAELSETDRKTVEMRLVKRLTSAVEKTLKEVREMKRRRRVKK